MRYHWKSTVASLIDAVPASQVDSSQETFLKFEMEGGKFVVLDRVKVTYESSPVPRRAPGHPSHHLQPCCRRCACFLTSA